MFTAIRNRVENELRDFMHSQEQAHHLKRISPLLAEAVREFILRPGKRVRPILFVSGFRGFSSKNAPGLYTSALAIELLHDFMLIHDDIIDRSTTRRGKPAMHTVFAKHLERFPKAQCTGEDLAIIAGDVVYAMAIDAFLAIKVDMRRKERALKKFIQAAFFTGCGEFIELTDATRSLEKISRKEIYRIYDYKTAFYTFACPLSSGAILAGASGKQVNSLHDFGMALGRAFQIKDDIIGLFADEKKIGKSTLTDLEESKKTVLIWYAYTRARPAQKRELTTILTKTAVTYADLTRAQQIILDTGSLSYARTQIKNLIRSAEKTLIATRMEQTAKDALIGYAQQILETA